MKTNIICIHGKFVVKTGRIFVYEVDRPIYDDEGILIDFGDVTFSEEIMDVCTGECFGFDGVIHQIGKPIDVYTSRLSGYNKRGRHSRSNNKKTARHLAFIASLNDDLPF